MSYQASFSNFGQNLTKGDGRGNVDKVDEDNGGNGGQQGQEGAPVERGVPERISKVCQVVAISALRISDETLKWTEGRRKKKDGNEER